MLSKERAKGKEECVDERVSVSHHLNLARTTYPRGGGGGGDGGRVLVLIYNIETATDKSYYKAMGGQDV